jgi:leucine dehydrogenase
VDTLAGRYITAEDVGTTVSDMEAVRSQTTAVVGTNRDHGGSGDPSPYTARGVYLGIKAAVKKTFSSDSLAGKHVAIKGVGNVGRNLTELLLKEDAQVTIADIDLEKVKMVQTKHPEVKVVTDEQIMEIECDVFSPCALGGGINDKTIASFKCPIIAGGANNQLAGPEHAHVLREKGILYVPDYVINAGGLINVSLEITGYDEKKSLELVDDIYFKVLKIFELADKKNISTAKAADQLVEEMLHIEPTKRIHVAQSATVGS